MTAASRNMPLAFVTPTIPFLTGRRALPKSGRPRYQISAIRMTAGEKLTYAASGVDIDTESASIKALITALGPLSQRKPGTPGAPVAHSGGFSGLIEFGDNLLAMCTDGVGSKLLLAAQLEFYETVPLDCMAMNVNDLLCIGAEPLAFVDYIAAPKPDEATWKALGKGLGEACRLARVSLCGGETASLPDMVNEIDMSGTALGWLPKGCQLEGRVKEGDVVIGLPSSGIHSNGYSLARKVVEKSGVSLRDPAPFDTTREGEIWRHGQGAVTLGEVLLNPTKIYVDPIADLLLACRKGNGPCSYDDLHGIAHITGGGLSNLLRIGEVGFVIDNPLPPQKEFGWMQQVGGITDYEMLRTFNMGMGMCVIVAEENGQSVCNWLQERLAGCAIVGRADDSGVVRHVDSGVVFDKY